MKRTLPLLALTLAILLTLGACNQNNDPSPDLGESGPATVDIVDREGNPVTVPTELKRIVSVSPAVCEILVDLGVGDKLVAVDKYSAGIPGVPDGLPVFDIMTPDVERLLELRADVILVTGMNKAKGDETLKPVSDAGIAVVYIPSSASIAAIEEDILFLGELVGEQDKAQTMVDHMRTQVAEVAAVGASIAESDRRTVYFEISPSPNLYSFGEGTFLNEIIGIVGADNILASETAWIRVSEEVVVAANPDVIITNMSEDDSAVTEIVNRNGWGNVAAVRDGRVHLVDRDASSRSNHNVILAMHQIAEAIYPEYYGG